MYPAPLQQPLIRSLALIVTIYNSRTIPVCIAYTSRTRESRAGGKVEGRMMLSALKAVCFPACRIACRRPGPGARSRRTRVRGAAPATQAEGVMWSPVRGARRGSQRDLRRSSWRAASGLCPHKVRWRPNLGYSCVSILKLQLILPSINDRRAYGWLIGMPCNAQANTYNVTLVFLLSWFSSFRERF